MSDYHVTVKVRNGRIIRLMRDAGIPTLAELARQAGVNYQRLVDLAGMKLSPVLSNGEWREAVLNISAVLRCMPDDLFNEQQRTSTLKTNTSETFMDQEEVALIMGQDGGGTEAIEAKIEVEQLMECLTPRERAMVEAPMAGATAKEVGEEHGIGRGGAQQVIDKAMRRMRVYAIRRAGQRQLEGRRLG